MAQLKKSGGFKEAVALYEHVEKRVWKDGLTQQQEDDGAASSSPPSPPIVIPLAAHLMYVCAVGLTGDIQRTVTAIAHVAQYDLSMSRVHDYQEIEKCLTEFLMRRITSTAYGFPLKESHNVDLCKASIDAFCQHNVLSEEMKGDEQRIGHFNHENYNPLNFHLPFSYYETRWKTGDFHRLMEMLYYDMHYSIPPQLQERWLMMLLKVQAFDVLRRVSREVAVLDAVSGTFSHS